MPTAYSNAQKRADYLRAFPNLTERGSLVLQDIQKQLLNHIYPALLLTMLLLLAWPSIQSGAWRTRLKQALRREGRLALFLLYLSLLLVSTVFSRHHIANPLRDLFSHFGPGTKRWNLQIIENVLLFVPYTLLGLTAFPCKRPIRRALLMSVALTMFIELSQLIFFLGYFQLSDLFHNVLGGLIGGGLWAAIHALIERLRQKKRN